MDDLMIGADSDSDECSPTLEEATVDQIVSEFRRREVAFVFAYEPIGSQDPNNPNSLRAAIHYGGQCKHRVIALTAALVAAVKPLRE